MNEFRYHDLGHAEVYVFENYILKQVREGATVTAESHIQFRELVESHYGDSKVVYLSNRVNNYSVDPVVYIKAAKIPQLIGIGIISREKSGFDNAIYEKHFYSKPFKIHLNLRDAIDWADDLLKEFHKTEEGKKFASSK